MFSGDLDKRAHAFDVQIGVAIPDAVFPVIISGIATMLDADRHLFRKIGASRLAIVHHPAHRRDHRLHEAHHQRAVFLRPGSFDDVDVELKIGLIIGEITDDVETLLLSHQIERHADRR